MVRIILPKVASTETSNAIAESRNARNMCYNGSFNKSKPISSKHRAVINHHSEYDIEITSRDRCTARGQVEQGQRGFVTLSEDHRRICLERNRSGRA